MVYGFGFINTTSMSFFHSCNCLTSNVNRVLLCKYISIGCIQLFNVMYLEIEGRSKRRCNQGDKENEDM